MSRVCQRPSGHTEFSRSPGSLVHSGTQSPLRDAGQPYLSVLGCTFSQTPLVLPVRGYLDAFNRLMTGDFYIGRGSRQRSLKRSIFLTKCRQLGGTERSRCSRRISRPIPTYSHVSGHFQDSDLSATVLRINVVTATSSSRSSQNFILVHSTRRVPLSLRSQLR